MSDVSRQKITNAKASLRAMESLFALCFLAIVALPVTAYFNNADALVWRGGDWLKQFAIVIILISPVFYLIHKSMSPVATVLNIIFIVSSAYIIIRNYFFPISHGIMDGLVRTHISIFSDKGFYISLALVILLLLFVIMKRSFINDIVVIITLAVFGFVAFMYMKVTFFEHRHSAYSLDIAAQSGYDKLSSKNNIIILSFDSIQGDLFYDVIEKHPNLREMFQGFFLYRDVIGYAPNTHFSIMSTLTGRYIPAGANGGDIVSLTEKFGELSLASNLRAKGFQVDVFNVPCQLALGAGCHTKENILSDQLRGRSVISAYDVSLLRILPVSLSWRLVNYLSSHNNTSSLIDNMLKDKEAHGFGLDLLAFQKLYASPQIVDVPVFKFYHYLFTHQPIKFNKTCEYDKDYFQSFDTASEEIVCTIREIGKFISKLQDFGIYDNTLLIITSDHGYESNIQPVEMNNKDYMGGTVNNKGVWSASRYWPILLIKNYNRHAPLEVSDAPVSLVDIAPTLCHAMPVEHCNHLHFNGRNLLSKDDEAKITTKKIMIYVGGQENIANKHTDTRLFEQHEVRGHYDKSVLFTMGFVGLSRKQLGCGQTVYFNLVDDQLGGQGLSGVEHWGRWSNAKKVRLLFMGDLSSCESNRIKLKLDAFVNQFKPAQHAKVLLNGVEIGNIDIHYEERRPKEISLNYPGIALYTDKINTLEFIIEDPVSPQSLDLSQDARALGLAFYSLAFE